MYISITTKCWQYLQPASGRKCVPDTAHLLAWRSLYSGGALRSACQTLHTHLREEVYAVVALWEVRATLHTHLCEEVYAVMALWEVRVVLAEGHRAAWAPERPPGGHLHGTAIVNTNGVDHRLLYYWMFTHHNWQHLRFLRKTSSQSAME